MMKEGKEPRSAVQTLRSEKEMPDSPQRPQVDGAILSTKYLVR
jgi:hypothetical protein